MIKQIRRITKRALRSLGLEVSRSTQDAPPAPVSEDLWLAVRESRCGAPVSYLAPLERCRIFSGFSFGETGWHPLVEAARELLDARREIRYEDSFLHAYYATWQPKDALEALIGVPDGPSSLRLLPSYTHHVPWLDLTPEERSRQIGKIIADENRWMGRGDLDASHGHGFQGPVSAAKGALEYERLAHLVGSLKRDGYDRRIAGHDPTAEVITRGTEYVLRITHGHHRLAALSAMGTQTVPVSINRVWHVEEADHWTSVYRGPWTRAHALQYVDHLFDFDSIAWAKAAGLYRVSRAADQ